MLGLIDNKFLIGRDVFSPISAEIHYFRVPKRYWSICFERIKKAGFRIISSFVPWNLHEEKPGEFDFQGLDNPFKDLIVFLELAREFGFKIILKPGPWIKAEWGGGGIPKYIFSDESLIARDSHGRLLMANPGGGLKPGYQPSYLHPKYLNHTKRYIGGLVEAIQNYIFPKGPVFLVQLDNEADFGGNEGVFDADYNDFVITKLYPAFLEEKYEFSKNLPAAYGKVKNFTGIVPPTEFALKKPEQLVVYFDWLEFKGKMLKDYFSALRDRWESLGVGCMFSLTMPSSMNFNIPVPWEIVKGERTILGSSIEYSDDIYRVTRKLRLAQSLAGYSWSSQLALGTPQGSTEPAPAIDHKHQKYLLISALAAGMKGINYYMFVGREKWQGSALQVDGTVADSYDDIRKLNLAFDVMDISSSESKSPIGIGAYKPYHWYGQLSSEGEFSYINDITDQTFADLLTDLSSMNFDYDIYDLDSFDENWRRENLNDNKILFVPCADYMSEKLQKKLIDLISEGLVVVFTGLIPRYDVQFKASKTLSKHLGISTKAAYGPATIATDNNSFKSLVYGYIQGKGSAKVIAKNGTKVVGVSKKLGKGKFYFFTYDIAANGESGRLGFLKEILSDNNITSLINCSDPDVEVVIRANEKGAVIYLLNSGKIHKFDNGKKKVVVSIDLAQIGFRQAKITLHDIFDLEKKIKTTSLELRDGLIFEMGHLDARIYWIPKK